MAQPTLLGMPPEIRAMIVSNLAPSFVWIVPRCRLPDSDGPIRWMLSLTHSQLHVEFRNIFWKDTVFALDFRSGEHNMHKNFCRFTTKDFAPLITKMTFYCARFTARVRIVHGQVELCVIQPRSLHRVQYSGEWKTKIVEFLQLRIEQQAISSIFDGKDWKKMVDWQQVYNAVGMVHSAYCIGDRGPELLANGFSV